MTPKLARRTGAAAAAAVLLAAAGCGGGGSAATTSPPATTASVAHAAPPPASSYVARMRRLGRALSGTLTAIGAANGASAAKDASNLRVAQVALRKVARRLAAISPPPRVRADHALLLKGVREYAEELNGVIARLQGGQQNALKLIVGLKGVKDMQRASNAIVHKGYDIVG